MAHIPEAVTSLIMLTGMIMKLSHKRSSAIMLIRLIYRGMNEKEISIILGMVFFRCGKLALPY